VRLVFMGVPHAVDMGSTSQAVEGLERWVRDVAWPVLRGDGVAVVQGGIDNDGGGGGSGGGGDSTTGGGRGGGGGERYGTEDTRGSSPFRFTADVVDVSRATFSGILLGHIEHERTNGNHYTDEGRRLIAQLLLNRLAMSACAPATAEFSM